MTFFDLENADLGDPIDWNRDPKSNKAAPVRFSPWIDYRNYQVTGDCKFVWEVNRHHHWVVLGRAYHISGEIRYAQVVADQLAGWLDACPFGMGMNWRSPLELGVRLINWVWAFDLIRDAGVMDQALLTRFVHSVSRHVWEISRKYSQGSSAGNHVIGEAAGVFVAASYFPDLKHAGDRRRRAQAILCEHMLRQTHADGGGKEQATGYHMFILEFFLLAALVGRKVGCEFPETYWTRLEKMCEFVAALIDGAEVLPMFGDGDDGYVLDLGEGPADARSLLAVAAVLFDRPDFKTISGGFREPAWWLLGQTGLKDFARIADSSTGKPLASRQFPETGCYVLQHGRHNLSDGMSVVFDCGPLGLVPMAGHGHADALNVVVRVFGVDVLVDPGTYDYFTHPTWRRYFRRTRAHNCVVIDDRDQSDMLGSFLWGRRAESALITWRPTPTGGTVIGEHDGYTRLSDPAIHRRELELDGEQGILTIRDHITARGGHDLAVYFHLSEHCRVQSIEFNRCNMEIDGGRVTLELDDRLAIQRLSGSTDPIGGWVSRGYHVKTPATTLIGRCRSDGDVTLVCRVTTTPTP